MQHLRCQHCHGALDPTALLRSGDTQCRSCGAADALTYEGARSVKRHLARLARGTERMRVAMRLTYAMKDMGKGCLAFLVSAVLGVAVFYGGGILLWDLVKGMLRGGGGNVAGSLMFMGGGAALLTVSILVFIWPSVIFFRRGTYAAREHALQIPMTFVGQCQSCGAPVTMPLWRGASSMPCPFCSTPLAPDGQVSESLAKARQAEVAAVGADAMRDLELAVARMVGSKDRRVRDKPRETNGKLATSADGIYEAQEGETRMWTTTEMYPGMNLFVFEVDAPLELAGSLWLLPIKHPQVHTELAPPRGLPVPTQQVRVQSATHTAWVDGSFPVAALESPVFLALMGRLDREESLRIDPGGLSFWSERRSGFNPRNWFYDRWSRDRSEMTTRLVRLFSS